MAVGAVVLVGLTIGGLFLWQQRGARARLPVLPDLASSPDAVGEHLRGLDAAARGRPGDVAAVGALCVGYQADLFYAEAAQCYAAATALDPADWRWTYYVGLLHGELSREDALLDAMRRVTEAAPDAGTAWWRLGDAEFKAGRYDAAREAWRRARSLEEPVRPPLAAGIGERIVPVPLAAYAELGLARVALLANELQEARRLLERLVDEAPTFGPVFRLLGDVYARLGRAEESADALRRADRLPPYAPYPDPLVDRLALESRNSTFLLQQVGAARIAGDLAWAEYLLRRAVEYDPENPDVVLSLGQLLRSTEQLDEALTWFRRHEELVPDDHRARAELGAVLVDAGRLPEAEAILREVVAELDDADTHYNLGLVLGASGRFEEAIGSYERAIARDPTRTDFRANLAVTLIRLGQLSRAVDELRALLAIDPDDDSAYTNLGLALADLGRPDQAVEAFREALRINPTQPQARTALETILPRVSF